MHQPTRRDFLLETTAASAGLALGAARAEDPAWDAVFEAGFDRMHDRVWTGPAVWANPLQDWRVAGGRLECVKAAAGRNVQVLTFETGDTGTLVARVTLGRIDGGSVSGGPGSAGFCLGVKGPLADFRNRLVFGTGFNCGVRGSGELFLGDGPNGKVTAVTLDAEAVTLRLEAEPAGEGLMRVTLTARDAAAGLDAPALGTVTRTDVPAEFFTGNLALVANYGAGGKKGPPPAGAARWWFRDWSASGSRMRVRPERAFGPIYFIQYTVHAGVLKLTAQMAPVGATEEQTVRLEFKPGAVWMPAGEARIDPLSRTASFRVEGWSEFNSVPLRVVYAGTEFNGFVRCTPVYGHLTVADISCNAHHAFPNVEAAGMLAEADPDLIAFTGDQYYEPSGGFGVDASSVENACLDVLRKWCLHGWTWRELTRDRPSVSIPDDHDVYHGNLWGEGGAAADANNSGAEARGGYKMFADMVNAVHRMQTSHHPDSPGAPGKQGITAYYGPLTWGGVSFAILADRQYKTGPAGKVPPTTTGRADHVNDPAFDPRTADLPGLDLLGAPQLKFLEDWSLDWKKASMKAVISQTIFTAMATHHGGKGGKLVADYDTNAWPQAARNDAVRAMRRCFAFHIAGDQHLPAVIRYGVDAHRDAGFAFAGPAVNNLYPRWFLPEGGKVTGDFTDSFGHPLTVIACANPKDERRPGVLESEVDKSAGVGFVTFDLRKRTIQVDCWPLLADVRRGNQFPGWPVAVPQLDNGPRPGEVRLPSITVDGVQSPLFVVRAEPSGELIHAYRPPVATWQPSVPAPGTYTVRVSDPETGRFVEEKGVPASAGNPLAVFLRLPAQP